jgi:hypothetical protein
MGRSSPAPSELSEQCVQPLATLGRARGLSRCEISERRQPRVDPGFPVTLALLAQNFLNFWLLLKLFLFEVYEPVARRLLVFGE